MGAPEKVEPETNASAEVALLLIVGRERREDAFLELYRRYERRLYGLGLRLLGDAGLAEELVQETSLRVWRSAKRFDPAGVGERIRLRHRSPTGHRPVAATLLAVLPARAGHRPARRR